MTLRHPLHFALRLLLTFQVSLIFQPVDSQPVDDPWLQKLLASKASPLLQHILNHPDSFQYQVIYTEINRDSKNRPTFINHTLHVDRNRYFNPASTVKLPVALAALEKINTLQRRGLEKFTPMFTDSSYSAQSGTINDSTSADGFPSIGHYIKKIFLVSDNEAYNRLYEFDGQQSLNENLWKKGYRDVRITRRFVTMTEVENRHTNAIRFVNAGIPVYYQEPAYSNLDFDFSKQVLVGRAHYNRYDSLIYSPMDFTRHNNLPLEDLRLILQSVLFPGSVPAYQRFVLTKDDRRFLFQYLSEYPSESRYPHYDTSRYFDSYTKFFLYKSGRQKPPSNIRIFNKPGWSYGFLTDAAYIVDFSSRIEFMLSAVIYVNRDGILNDDKYEYDELGYPFFAELGEILMQYEKTRKRKHTPDLGIFKMEYADK